MRNLLFVAFLFQVANLLNSEKEPTHEEVSIEAHISMAATVNVFVFIFLILFFGLIMKCEAKIV